MLWAAWATEPHCVGKIATGPSSRLRPHCPPQPLTLPDAAAVDEDLHGEGGVGRLEAVEQEGVAAQRGHVGGEDHRALRGRLQ